MCQVQNVCEQSHLKFAQYNFTNFTTRLLNNNCLAQNNFYGISNLSFFITTLYLQSHFQCVQFFGHGVISHMIIPWMLWIACSCLVRFAFLAKILSQKLQSIECWLRKFTRQLPQPPNPWWFGPERELDSRWACSACWRSRRHCSVYRASGWCEWWWSPPWAFPLMARNQPLQLAHNNPLPEGIALWKQQMDFFGPILWRSQFVWWQLNSSSNILLNVVASVMPSATTRTSMSKWRELRPCYTCSPSRTKCAWVF